MPSQSPEPEWTHSASRMCFLYLFNVLMSRNRDLWREEAFRVEDLPAGWSLSVFSPFFGEGGQSLHPYEWVCGCCIYREGEWEQEERISHGLPGNKYFLPLLGSWDWKNVSRRTWGKQLSGAGDKLKLAAEDRGNYKWVQLLTPVAYTKLAGLFCNCAMFRPSSHTNIHTYSEDTYFIYIFSRWSVENIFKKFVTKDFLIPRLVRHCGNVVPRHASLVALQNQIRI